VRLKLLLISVFRSLAYHVFIFCQKWIVLLHVLLSHNHLIRCSFSVVNSVVVTALLLLTLLLATNVELECNWFSDV